MPAPILKSRSLRKVYVKTPGGRTVTHYRFRKPKPAVCASCGAVLKGTPNKRPIKMKQLPKSKKRPSRLYSNLCSRCSRKKIINEAIKNV
jgi:large subunit ribosomal protein L34e